jgi:hypothetical protein
MHWKMSIELSYPLVPSMGHHDPLDGLITYLELQGGLVGEEEGTSTLAEEIGDMAAICKGKDWSTDDPLGLGGLLSDAYRVAQMLVSGISLETDLLAALLDACRIGLARYARTESLKAPASYRLAFRELGLAIGLHALERLQHLIAESPAVFQKAQPRQAGQVEILLRYGPLAAFIEEFWLAPTHREGPTFVEHRDINTVMLATSLIPDGYLRL